MAIAYVQTVTPWEGVLSATSGSFTPGGGDTIIVAGSDVVNYPQVVTISGSSGSYSVLTPPGTFEDDDGDTWQLAYQLSAAAAAQTITVATDGVGDYVIGAAVDYSGVASVSANANSLALPGTGNGAVAGLSVVVPVGSVLVAIAVDVSLVSPAPTAFGATATRASGQFGVSTFGYCIAEWAGAGGSITPAFTSTGGATDYFTVSQFLLSPPGQTLLGQVLT